MTKDTIFFLSVDLAADGEAVVIRTRETHVGFRHRLRRGERLDVGSFPGKRIGLSTQAATTRA